MKEDLDNVVNLASRRQQSTSDDSIVHTLVCLGLQKEIYESQIAHLKRTNRAMFLISFAAYIMGMYLGWASALHYFDAP